jgi:sulfatase modifying factor 1
MELTLHMELGLLNGCLGAALLAGSLALACNASDERSSPPTVQANDATDALQADDARDAAAADTSLVDREPETCESGTNHGPTMVEISTATGYRYCIDSTEVTEAQYQEFLATVSFAPGTEHARCSGNETYQPGVWFSSSNPQGGCNPLFWTPELTPNWPVSCVDWCDAYAYCKWAGKRLCGGIAGGEDASPDNVDSSQWGYACSQGGVTRYPYGDEFSSSTCDGATFAGTEKFDQNCGCFIHSDVGSWTACHGSMAPWDSIHDMSGSVAEWTDHCSGDASVGIGCLARGGGMLDNSPDSLACSNELGLTFYRSTRSDTGFRCCKDLD